MGRSLPVEWIQAMRGSDSIRTDEGWARLVIMHNVIERELEFDNVDPGALDELFKRLILAPGPDAPHRALEAAIDSLPRSIRRGRALPNQAVQVSCVVHGLKLKRHLRSQSKGLDWSEETERRLADDARAGKLTGRSLKADAGGVRVTWVTPTDAIATLRTTQPADKVALATRKRLGLVAGPVETLYWFEYRYRGDALAVPGVPELRTPTVLDAGAWPLFRPRRTSPDRWGMTVDLDTLQDGAPEAVHENGFPVDLRIEPLGTETPAQKADDPPKGEGFFERLYSVSKRML